MTLFDLIAIAILVISALIGFQRGAVRELVTVFAFTLAALAALYMMPVARPIAAPPRAPRTLKLIGWFLSGYSSSVERSSLGAMSRSRPSGC